MDVKKVDILKAVEAAKISFPVSHDASLSFLSSLKTGSPFIVFNPDGEPAFWMVTLMKDDYVCGFANLDLEGKVIRMGMFGSDQSDHSSWIEGSFFNQPPVNALNEIEKRFPGYAISKPLFSFDSDQSRWAWLLKLRSKDDNENIVFVTPGGWYEKTLNPPESNYEK